MAARRPQAEQEHLGGPPAVDAGDAAFRAPMVGVVHNVSSLDKWDGPCAVPGVTYPLPASRPRGLENTAGAGGGCPLGGVVQADFVRVLQGGNGSWDKVAFQSDRIGSMDQVRVIACVDSRVPSNCRQTAESIGLGASARCPEMGGRVALRPPRRWFPGLAIMAAVLARSLLGGGRRDALELKLWGH